jgi:hypothetical protein
MAKKEANMMRYLMLLCTAMMNNIESKREKLKKNRDTNLTWFDNVPTSTERRLYFAINDSGLHYNIYIEKTLNANCKDIFWKSPKYSLSMNVTIAMFTLLSSTWPSTIVNMSH